jgi:hypothetical protein
VVEAAGRFGRERRMPDPQAWVWKGGQPAITPNRRSALAQRGGLRAITCPISSPRIPRPSRHLPPAPRRRSASLRPVAQGPGEASRTIIGRHDAVRPWQVSARLGALLALLEGGPEPRDIQGVDGRPLKLTGRRPESWGLTGHVVVGEVVHR